MAVDRLKFRCYQCTQLLAVSPSKAGSIVACPKCKAELLIPAPADEPSPAAGSARMTRSASRDQPSSDPTSSNGPRAADEPFSLFPPEIADLRPEDIRIEASVLESLVNPARTESEPADEPRFSSGLLNFSEPSTPRPSPRGDGPRSSLPVDPRPAPEFSSLPTDQRAASPGSRASGVTASEPNQAGPLVLESDPVISIAAIDFEPPSITRTGAEKRTIREVVLPAGVVLAWSLFVLLSLGMAFIAGLLVGHFLWTPGG